MFREKANDAAITLCNAIGFQFNSRTATEARKTGTTSPLFIEQAVRDNVIYVKFGDSSNNTTHTITIPVPYIENGVEYICLNEVVRPVCRFWKEAEQAEVGFMAVMMQIALGSPDGIVSKDLVKRTPYVQQMVYGFKNGNASVVAHKFQKAINEVVAMMPLHETVMNSFIMNSRLVIIDSEFVDLKSPEERLNYQVKKAKKYFSQGWTSIGLSDGTLADKNYILKTNLVRFSPFGNRFHNPQRNLYSTLGMKGDELPLIRSTSMQNLMDYGVTRKGWNWFTAFVDVPDVFEDQILVDNIHRDKYVTYKRRLQVFGTLAVKTGDKVKEGAIIGRASDGVPFVFEVPCDSAEVINIKDSVAMVGSNEEPVFHVTISYRRYFCDGFKVTNLHGNKGVIRMMDLGYAVDPRTGSERKIDIIVGAKTVGKRKNYGQVMEALLSSVIEADKVPTGWDFARKSVGYEVSGKVKPTVIPDNWCQPMDEVKAGLTRRGYRDCGTWECNTHAGRVKAICGTVFWGVIKTPHDQLWKHDATINTNTKDARKAGLKFSHIEFRGLTTRFGADSPVLDEIMSYSQGSSTVNELIKVLKSRRYEFSKDTETYDYTNLKHIKNELGTVVNKNDIVGTVVDDMFAPTGFMFHLPLNFMTVVGKDSEIIYTGREIDVAALQTDQPISAVYCTDRIYFPAGHLRRCWRHDSGKFGMSEIGVAVNNVMVMVDRLRNDIQSEVNYDLYYNAVSNYFNEVDRMICGKNGEISNSTMSVRYPFSIKAVATLSTTLPKNTIEIHRSMAKVLRAENGSVSLCVRYPCLGFISIPPQKIKITDDPMCKYTIRASNNSLVCTNLDFDGDVLYAASFHTPEARKALNDEWTNPNRTCYEAIEALNNRKGAPHIKEFTLGDINIKPFEDLDNDGHAVIVEKNTGVKAQTGPVIALTYNIMRLVEDSDIANTLKDAVALELFTEKAAQSVFEQKHGGVSLHEVVMNGVCTGDVEKLVEVGFKRGITEKLVGLIKKRALELGISDIEAYHEKAKADNKSNIISTIVRERNRIYYMSRSYLSSMEILDAIEQPAVDIPSKMFKWVMAGGIGNKTTMLDKVLDKKLLDKASLKTKDVCSSLFEIVDKTFGVSGGI